MQIKINCTATDFLPISKLTNLQGDLKSLSKENYEKLRNHILTFGFSSPFHVWKDGEKYYILDGTQRFRTLQQMQADGCELPDLPITFIQARDIQEARAILISLASTYGEVSNESLYEFMHIAEMPMDIIQDYSYFPNIDYDKFEEYSLDLDNKDKYDETKEDEIPEVTEAICKEGDIWQLGQHRLLCGDCTKKENVELLMNNEKADMVFTDPPYGVNYTKKNKEIFNNKNYTEIKNDDLAIEDISLNVWKPTFKNIYEIAKDDCSFYMTMPQGGDQMMMMMMMKELWQVKHELIWLKESPVFSMGRLDYDYQHEPIMYGWKNKHNFYGKGKYNKSIWEIKREGNKLHPTTKPVELIENALLNSTNINNNIIDPFGGSGSTLIACEKLNRKCFMMEIDPHYCDVIIKRWEQYTGKKVSKLN